MKTTLNDAYQGYIESPNGSRMYTPSSKYLSRDECTAWLVKRAKSGDKIVMSRSLTGNTVLMEVKG